jgi:predicted transcriptional regulator
VAEIETMKRPDLYVVARFLERLRTPNKEWKKPELQIAVGLNYNVYTKYLNWLKQKGLIILQDVDDGHQAIKITQKGVDAYNTMASWIRDVVCGNH